MQETIGCNNYEQPEAELRRQALVFIVHVLTHLSQADCLASVDSVEGTGTTVRGGDEAEADGSESSTPSSSQTEAQRPASSQRVSRGSSSISSSSSSALLSSKSHGRCPESYAGPTPLAHLHRTGLQAYWDSGEKLNTAVKAIKAEAERVAVTLF